MNKSDLLLFKKQRQLCRTDLVYLAKILDFPDVGHRVTKELREVMQQFPLPPDGGLDNDHWDGQKFTFTPYRPILELPGKRRKLILISRGTMKTTTNCVVETIQWIINYPDIAIAIITADLSKAKEYLKEIKHAFIAKDKFRALFPELCPVKRNADLGTQEEFTTPGRQNKGRRDATVSALTIEGGAAGSHFDIIKFSDTVNEANITTEGLPRVSNKMALMEDLLISQQYWIYVEGTRYHEEDAYGNIIRAELAADPSERQYDVVIKGILEWAGTDIDKRTYGVEEALIQRDICEYIIKNSKMPVKELAKKFQSNWEERFPVDQVIQKFRRNPYVTACQQFMWPQQGIGGEAIFPVSENRPRRIPREIYKTKVPIIYREVIVDTAETTASYSNYSVITTITRDRNNRVYVEDIQRGKWQPAELCRRIVKASQQPHVSRVKIEETSFVRGLKESLERLTQTANVQVPYYFMKRETAVSKAERIMNGLQPPFENGDLILLDDLTELEAALNEFRTFSPQGGGTDDILDTLADAFANHPWSGPTGLKPAFWVNPDDAKVAARHIAMGWPNKTGIYIPEQSSPQDPYFHLTGGL